MSLSLTVEEFIRIAGPCNVDRVRAIGGAKTRWTAIDVLSLSGVSAEDRLWAVMRPELMTAKIVLVFASDCALRALQREMAYGRDPDSRSVHAAEAVRSFLAGDTSLEELKTARSAAWAAAGTARAAAWAAAGTARAAARAAANADSAAAWSAARSAEGAVAWASEGASAWAASWAANAAWSAAWAAEGAANYAEGATTRNSAWASEKEWQVKHLLSLLETSS